MKNTTDHFWTWFLEHKNKLKGLRNLSPKEQKHYTFWLDWHLQFYFRGLEYILIFPKLKNKQIQLLITANGNHELFNLAIDLEKTAPRLWDWKITALIQPHQDHDDMKAGLGVPYIMQDITLKTSELKFFPLEYNGENKIDIIVYLKNYTVYSHNKNLLLLINIIIQDLLGEKSMCENINLVQLAQVPNQGNDEMIYLYELQLYIDKINILQPHNFRKHQ
ncbi:hypothetical protein [Flavobacterium terrisoli]|uniref:hypothetical protein n=1 Tax=Flavobacterium terrisoli TaxID=3242195 RepID=UPI0025430A0F|nr:hypothetical protein [Flavobacterium buctense]